MGAKALFDDDEDDVVDSSLKVSSTFAKKFEYEKDREELQRLKAKHQSDTSESEESEDEDSDAELSTVQVGAKVLELVARLRTKQNLDKKVVFSDQDFEDDKEKSNHKIDPKVTYTQFLVNTLKKDGAEAFTSVEEKDERVLPTTAQMQDDARRAFLDAAKQEDEDFVLEKVEKSKEEQEEDKNFYEKFLKSKVSNETLGDYLEVPLDNEEKFLRDYILFDGWKNKKKDNQSDNEDESDDGSFIDTSEQFENAYNLRNDPVFSQTAIEGHARKLLDSVRAKEEKRKAKRLQRKERKAAEKAEKEQELARLRKLKEKEIFEKIAVAQSVAGVNRGMEALPDSIVNEFEEDFNDETHERCMQALLGEDYEEQDDQEAFLEKEPKLDDTIDDEDEEEGVEGKGGTDDGLEEEQSSLWFQCDQCLKPIAGGRKRYECSKCENYCVCAKCFRATRHKHRLAAKRVPPQCKPPPLLADLSLDGPLDEPTPDCMDSEEMKKLLDEYYALHCEDIIAGNLPTRFKYVDVKPADFGLTTDDIMAMNNTELNQIVSLKKLAPYRPTPSLKKLRNAKRFGRFSSLAKPQKRKRGNHFAELAPIDETLKEKQDASVNKISDARLAAYGLTRKKRHRDR